MLKAGNPGPLVTHSRRENAMRFRTAAKFVALTMLVLLVAPALVRADVFAGKVVVADAGKLTIIDKDGDNEDFIISADTKITLNGKPGRLDQLKGGDSVKVTATVSGDKMTASQVEARSAE
jgi:hypothetical protein